MEDVAATVIGASRSASPTGIPERIATVRKTPPGLGMGTVCIISCVSLGLVVTGIVFISLSRSNTRELLVAEYDGAVGSWNASARAEFGSASFNVTARASMNAQVPVELAQSSSKDFVLRDSEDGQGVDAYMPLKFTASLRFRVGHLNTSSGRDREPAWELLPARADATAVNFDFSAQGPGGSTVHLGSVDLPLVFGEALHPSTEYPDTDCRSTQHGVWRSSRCHVVKRLARLCLVLEHGPGAWRFLPLPRNGSALANVVALPPLHGCDPVTSWDPAAYARDLCWGPWPDRRKCSEADRQRMEVEVTLRSAADPFLRAEELTRDHFDFGSSAESQRASGLACIVLGFLLAIVPLMRVSEALCPWRRSGSMEERERFSVAGERSSRA